MTYSIDFGVIYHKRIGMSLFLIEILHQQGLFFKEFEAKNLGTEQQLPRLLLICEKFDFDKKILKKITDHIS